MFFTFRMRQTELSSESFNISGLLPPVLPSPIFYLQILQIQNELQAGLQMLFLNV